MFNKITPLRLKVYFSYPNLLSILKGEKTTRPFLYIVTLSMLLTLIPGFVLLKVALPITHDLESKALSLVDNIFPDDLEIKITNGYLTTNVTEPYYITVKKEALEDFSYLFDEDEVSSTRIRLLAIDTNARAEDFERYQSFGLLTRESFVYYDEGQIKMYPLRDVEDLTVNKNIVVEKIQNMNKDNKIGKIANVIVFMLPLFIFLGIFIGSLFTLLYVALLIYLIVRILKVNFSYANVFKFTVYVFLPIYFVLNMLAYIPDMGVLSESQTVLNIILITLSYLILKRTTKSQSVPQPEIPLITETEQQK